MCVGVCMCVCSRESMHYFHQILEGTHNYPNTEDLEFRPCPFLGGGRTQSSGKQKSSSGHCLNWCQAVQILGVRSLVLT